MSAEHDAPALKDQSAPSWIQIQSSEHCERSWAECTGRVRKAQHVHKHIQGPSDVGFEDLPLMMQGF